jgi:hypothetical protein
MELSVALAAATKQPTGKFGTARLKKGETLKMFAKRKLGSAAKWTTLRNNKGKLFTKNEGHPAGTIVKYPQ